MFVVIDLLSEIGYRNKDGEYGVGPLAKRKKRYTLDDSW